MACDDRFVGVMADGGVCCLKHHASHDAARRCARRAAQYRGTPDDPVGFVVATEAQVEQARRLRAQQTRRALEALAAGVRELVDGGRQGSGVMSVSYTMNPADPVTVTHEED